MNRKLADRDVYTEAKRAALLAITAEHGGRLHAQAIVEAAEDIHSPLHDEFEWDDGEAAARYRLAQAGALVRRLKLVIMRSDEGPKIIKISEVREFHSRDSQRAIHAGMETLESIMEDPAKREDMLQTCLHAMESYRSRYRELSELAAVWGALDDVLLEHKVDNQRRARKHRGGDEARA